MTTMNGADTPSTMTTMNGADAPSTTTATNGATATVESFCAAHQNAGMAYNTLLALVLQAPDKNPLEAIKRIGGEVNTYFGVTKVREARVHVKGYATASNDISSARTMIKAIGLNGIRYAYENNLGRNEADSWRKEHVKPIPTAAPASTDAMSTSPATTYDAEAWRLQEDALQAAQLEVSRLRETIAQAAESLKLRHYKEAARILLAA